MFKNSELASCRILALDDHPIQVKIFQKILETQGFDNITGISDPKQCLALHQETPFDLMIVDLDMPELDGFAVIEQLMELSGNNFLPIIVVTSSLDKEDMIRALQLGARDFVSRPVHREELTYRVGHLLEVKLAFKKLPTALRPKNARIDPNAIRQGRILVVEDDAQQRIIIEKMLKTGGFNNVSILDNLARLESFMAAQQAPFELVILDLHLPGLSSKEAADTIIQGTPQKSKPYILAISSDNTNEVRWDAFRDGAWDFINKPIDRGTFIAKVENIIELRLMA